MEDTTHISPGKPIVIDIFCGAGGLSLGFEMAGYHIGMGVEKDTLAFQTHCYNFRNACYLGDISEIASPLRFVQEHGLKYVDVVVGGPPCQGFSRVGRGKMRSLRGDPMFIHDPRNQYYREFIRFVESLRPLYFVMENVPDLMFYCDGEERLLDKALAIFRKELGYKTDFQVLHADHFGVPQTRKRLFIVGNRIGKEIRWPEPLYRDHPVTVWNAISDLPVIPHNYRLDEIPYQPRHELNRYQQLMREGAGDVLYNHQTRFHNEQDLAAFAHMPEGGKYVDLPQEFKRYRDDIFRDKYRKLYRHQPSWTIEAHIGKDTYRHIYPSIQGEPEPPRTISVREAARLQSFPDRFRFLGPFTRQFYQLGNAVPPILAKAVAETILPEISAVSGNVKRLGTSDEVQMGYTHCDLPVENRSLILQG